MSPSTASAIRQLASGTADGAHPRPAGAGWAAPTRIVFRFAFLYLLFYLIPRPFVGDPLPRLPFLTPHLARGWNALIGAVGTTLFDLPAGMRFNFGGGDAPADYIRVLCCVVLAAAGTGVWSLLSHAREHCRLHEGLRLYLRVILAIAMAGYAMPKLFGTQFAFSPIQLVRPVGELEPMQLLWVFMGYSPAYAAATGIVELTAGLLLVFRRTTLAGALAAFAALTNVVALNLSYDVGVKLWSIHLLLIAAFLLAADARRLAEVFFVNRAMAAGRVRAGRSRTTQALVLAAKLVLVGFVLLRLTQLFGDIRRQGHPSTSPALSGLYTVTVFVRDGVEIPPVTTAAARWRVLVIDRSGAGAVQMMNGAIQHFGTRLDSEARVLELGARGVAYRFSYAVVGPDRVLLEGGLEGQPMQIELRRIPSESLPLLARQFRWVR